MADELFIVKEGDIYYVVEAKAVFEPPGADSTDEQKDAYAELEALVAAGPQQVAVRTAQGDLGGVHGYHAEPPPSDDP
jgi:hypothetical protein